MNFSNLLCKGNRLYLTMVAVAILTFVASGSAKTGPTHNKVVACYIYTRSAHGFYSLQDLNPDLCTHVIFAFAPLKITQEKSISNEEKNELSTGLKKRYPHLKVILAVGGNTEYSESFSTLTSDTLERKRFVKEIAHVLNTSDFDGLDLNWVYPTQRGGMAKDRENFVLLIKELRDEFDKYNLLLISSIAAQKDIIDDAYDVRELSRYLDFLHVMCYDYHGSWEKRIGFNAPLASTTGDVLSVQYTIEYLIKLGAPPSKLVLGLPFYGRSFNTTFEGTIGDVSEYTGLQGPFTREDGFLGYNEICLMLNKKNSGWTSSWDAKASEVIARSERDESKRSTRIVIFDSSRSIANKVMFAMRKSLAGVSVWSVDTDDFLGECEPVDDTFTDFKRLDFPKRLNRTYPLLRTINEATIYALEEIEMEQQVQEQQKERQAVQETEEQVRQQTKEREVEQQVNQDIKKKQVKEPEKKEMNPLICFLTIPKRCFPNI